MRHLLPALTLPKPRLREKLANVKIAQPDLLRILTLAGHFADLGNVNFAQTQFLTRVTRRLRIDHTKPNCNSWEYYKTVLDDQSRGVFCGRIYVAPDAQKTDAKQTSMNLLLSEEASITTMPQLDIFADDVKCTHGATIGQIEESQLFYLQSRGIDKVAAKTLLIYAFANETIAEIKIEELRARLERVLLDRLPRGELLQGGLS